MRGQRPGRAVAALTVLALVLVVLSGVLTALTPADSGLDLVSALVFLLLPVSFSLVGGLLGVRLPGHGVGRLCLAIGLLWSLQSAGFWLAAWLASRGEPAAAGWIALVGTLWLPAAGLTGTHLVLRLPTGRLPSARWRWFSRACTAVLVVAVVVSTTAPGQVADVPGTRNPLGSPALQALDPIFLLVPVVALGSVASLVLRYRRAGGTERLQIRAIALGGVGLLAILVLLFVPTTLGLAAEGSAPAFVDTVAAVAFAALPVAIAVAVLRYRLYDLDSVINRTLVYALLTATLAGVYTGSVLLLQVVLSGATGGSALSVALSTLAAAGLFRPARARIQRQVDRRFYRRKYDAQRTVADFAQHLRDEVELEAIVGRMHDVVAETVQPATASLWIRTDPGRLRAGRAAR